MNAQNRPFAAHRLTGGMTILLIVLSLAGCNLPAAQGGGAPPQGDAAPPPPAEGGEADQEEAEDSGGTGDDTGIVSLACPTEREQFQLAISHTFNFSPNRETDVYSVTAYTAPGSWCLVEVQGERVFADPCNYTYTYEGFVTSEGTRCEMSGSGRASVEITGTCAGGRVTLTIAEYDANEGLGGTMACPQAPPVPYGMGVPLTNETFTFAIATAGETFAASADPDTLGHFGYVKNWTLTLVP
jgi:hypothetical protein